MAIDKQTFDERVDVKMVGTDDFLAMIKARRTDFSDANINRGRAYQYEDDGRIKILIKKEGIPDEFLPYIREHEVWEAFAANEEGLDLVRLARNDLATALRGNMPSINDASIDQVFTGFVNEYNFDYKHEFAISKEYRLAEKEGNLDRYHEFIMEIRRDDLQKYADDPSAVRKTQNDMRIRESIYSKIKNGTKHHFSRILLF